MRDAKSLITVQFVAVLLAKLVIHLGAASKSHKLQFNMMILVRQVHADQTHNVQLMETFLFANASAVTREKLQTADLNASSMLTVQVIRHALTTNVKTHALAFAVQMLSAELLPTPYHVHALKDTAEILSYNAFNRQF